MDELPQGISEFERATAAATSKGYVLRLFVAGTSPRSQRAILNVQKICRESAACSCELQVIDIFQQPALAKAEQICAVPTLIKQLPVPRRLFVGDLSDTQTILAGLNA